MAKKILIVDDDVDYLVQMSTYLKSADFEVRTADTVETAKELLKQDKPDLAIVDLMIENFDDGFRLCHHIKSLDAKIPVILLTAVASQTGIDFDASTKEERSWIKADTVLDKPIRFEQLQQEIDHLLHG